MNCIYVMKKDIKDKMLKAGFTLLKEDEASSIWIFANNDELKFELAESCPHIVYSDILSF